MNTLVLALAVLLALAAQEQPPTFRATTRLVELTVTALDKKGQAVTDLRAEDFTIQDNGKARPVTFFKYDGESSTEPAILPLPPGVVSNRADLSPGPPRNVTALVLDELNTPPLQNMRVRATATRYLKALAPRTRLAIFYLGTKVRILHDFTDDAESLRARIEKAVLAMPLQNETDFNRSVVEAEQFVNMFKGDPVMEQMAEEMMRTQLEHDMNANAASRRARLETTLASMESLGQHLAGIPGRKNVVWISGGISMLTVTGAMGIGPRGSIESFEDKVKRTAQRLAQQGIVLYIVDAKGLDSVTMTTADSAIPMPVRGRGRFEPQQDAETISSDGQPAMELLSSTTGGRYLRNTNDLMDGFKKAASDLEGSYTLGFYVSEHPDNKWHTLKASVARSGVNLRHRKGYLAEADAANSALWTNEKAMAVIANPIGSSAVQLTAGFGPAAEGEPGTFLVNLRIETGSLQFRTTGDVRAADLEILFAERTPNGAARLKTVTTSVRIGAQNWDTAQAEGLRYTHQWKPAPGALSLRVVVHDMITNRYGTLDIPLARTAQSRH